MGKKIGILIPLYTIRTKQSLGTGDYLSLIEFGKWCSEVGINLIQLLPINDSGTDPSPYSALSAFALHPLFIRISALPEYQHASTIEQVQHYEDMLENCENKDRLNYHEVLNAKISILRILFQKSLSEITKNKGFQNWILKNNWVREYAVFRNNKDKNLLRSWIEWTEYSDPHQIDIDRIWKDESSLFYAWIQYRIEEQFLEASRFLKSKGILLKGDIPILMNEDSDALWAHRELFDFDLRAGAPPDMFATLGQNWGFPIYNWNELEKQNYSWWRQRLRQAAKFYDAYRIDHVLGFFRIWATHTHHFEAALGFFTPAYQLGREELNRLGFSNERIFWLNEPHRRPDQLAQYSTNEVNSCFKLHYDHYIFRENIRGEKDIRNLAITDNAKADFLDIYRDRTLILVNKDDFALNWTFRETSPYSTLNDEEKQKLEAIAQEKISASEEIWADRGRKLLGIMRSETEMLCCAEDLGVVPDCVPQVLSDLDILSLKIPRWEYDAINTVYTAMKDYPEQSVTALSVHDTSTVREWWECEEGSEAFWQGLEQPKPEFNTRYSPEIAERVLSELIGSNSRIVVLQIQDFFALSPKYRSAKPQQERMNVPGTVQDSNWSYRMPLTVEELRSDKKFATKLRSLTSIRK